MAKELTVNLRRPHPKQTEFIDSPAARKCIRAGRRSGKTSGVAILAVEQFLRGRRILYATPTQEQVDRFWHEVKQALAEPVDAGLYYKNETKHIIELPGTEQRIRGKTAWDADSLRGDFCDILILDEFQDMDEEAWTLVGAPMLLDRNGDAIFIYTKKRGKNHTDALFKRAQADTSGRWATFVFSSHDNPHISEAALADITGDMTNLAYRMEIMAEDIEDDPRALWNRGIIDHVTSHPELSRIVVGVDPSGSATGNECGIVTAGIAKIGDVIHGYVIDDKSLLASAAKWGLASVTAYHHNKADRIIGEVNFGGDMVENTIRTVEGGKNVSFKAIRASRGKAARAEPVAALYENKRVHHVGDMTALEDEQCNWVPGDSTWSPNRLDAAVWALTELMLGDAGPAEYQDANPFYS
jgi:phage terminase large subunit-like protein